MFKRRPVIDAGFACPLCDTIQSIGWQFSVAITDQDSGRISQGRQDRVFT